MESQKILMMKTVHGGGHKDNMSTKQDHKRWRKSFNESCLERDGHKCVFCGATENLDVHHITNRHEMPNGGYATSNGITVCNDDHLKCEGYNGYDVTNDGFSPNDLYKKIGSSYSEAYLDSLSLK